MGAREAFAWLPRARWRIALANHGRDPSYLRSGRPSRPIRPLWHRDEEEGPMDDTRSERITKAEEGLAEAQTVLDQAKRAVEAADRADRSAREAAEHARSIARAALIALVVVTVALIGGVIRRRR